MITNCLIFELEQYWQSETAVALQKGEILSCGVEDDGELKTKIVIGFYYVLVS